jgi:hypothetical protein
LLIHGRQLSGSLSSWGAVQSLNLFEHLSLGRKVERFARDIANVLGTIEVLCIFSDDKLDMPARC